MTRYVCNNHPWNSFVGTSCPYCKVEELLECEAELASLRSEYDDVAKFATQYERERDEARAELERLRMPEDVTATIKSALLTADEVSIERTIPALNWLDRATGKAGV